MMNAKKMNQRGKGPHTIAVDFISLATREWSAHCAVPSQQGCRTHNSPWSCFGHLMAFTSSGFSAKCQSFKPQAEEGDVLCLLKICPVTYCSQLAITDFEMGQWKIYTVVQSFLQ